MKNKHAVMRNLVTGMMASALLMVSDWLMGATGKGNVSNGVVQSNWASAATWRYEAAMLIAGFAVFMLYSGMKEMIRQFKLTRSRKDVWSIRAARIFEIGGIATVVSTLFLHAKGSILPILYHKLYATSLMGADMLTVVDEVFFYISIPFYIFSILIVVFTSVPFIYQIWQGRLRVPKWFVILNPMVFWVIGWIFRRFGAYLITDFTACMVSFGLLMMFWCTLQHVTKIPDRTREE